MLPLLSSPFCTFFSLLSSFFKGCATEGILGLPRCLWCSFEHIYHMVIVYKRRAPLALVLGSTPDAPGHMVSIGWRLPVALGPSSPTTFYPCGLEGPAPDSLCVFRRELEVLSEAPPSIRRRAAQARIFRGSPPPVPKPRRDATSPKRFPLFAHTWPAHGGHQLGRKAAGF